MCEVDKCTGCAFCIDLISLVVADGDALELVAIFLAHAEVSVYAEAVCLERSTQLMLAVLPSDVVLAMAGERDEVAVCVSKWCHVISYECEFLFVLMYIM